MPEPESPERLLRYPPKRCPFCGAKLTGGGECTAYYECGSHLWVIQARRCFGDERQELLLYGHDGACAEEEDEQ